MRLTRRDAVFGAATGLLAGTGLTGLHEIRQNPPDEGTTGQSESLTEEAVTTMVAVAEVVYPSSVEVTPGFVEGYVRTLDPDHVEAIVATTDALDDTARSVAGDRFSDLAHSQREAVLRELGVGSIHPRRDGTVAARVRYHLVNGLLLALLTAPKGSQLFGIDNPLGYPGGYHGTDQIGAEK